MLYSKLELEADYFMLEGLRDWISAKKYIEVISTTVRTDSTGAVKEMGDVVVENFCAKTGGDYFACPTGYHASQGSMCWETRLCQHIVPKEGRQWVASGEDVVTVVTRIVFDDEVLRNIEYEQGERILH